MLAVVARDFHCDAWPDPMILPVARLSASACELQVLVSCGDAGHRCTTDEGARAAMVPGRCVAEGDLTGFNVTRAGNLDAGERRIAVECSGR